MRDQRVHVNRSRLSHLRSEDTGLDGVQQLWQAMLDAGVIEYADGTPVTGKLHIGHDLELKDPGGKILSRHDRIVFDAMLPALAYLLAQALNEPYTGSGQYPKH
jgi:hypothetical protein